MTALAASLFVALLAPPIPPQGADPAADAPPRIEWQRSLADALAVQAATGLPLLVVVNMDGEVFNDRFAGTTYKDPEFVASTRGYVCVVASPDRHTERDYDALGNRIECPRFPGCTCSEHIQIEPELFRRYFQGTRNAPRHVGVSAEGKVLFDRFLDQSMQTAIDAIAKHRGAGKPLADDPTSPFAGLLQRRDAAARRAIEQLYRAGDAATKRTILAAAAQAPNEPFDLLRMALREDDPALFGLAAAALAKVATKDTLIDVEDALARLDDAQVQGQLVARLQELGRTDKAAARLHSHFDRQPEPLPAPWRNAWSPAAFAADDRATIEAQLDRCEATLRTAPKDDVARLQLAMAQAGLADLLAREGGKGVDLWYADAERSSKLVAAEELQAEAQAVLAVAAWQRGEADAARTAIVRALGTAQSPRQPDAWLAQRLLEVTVQTTVQAAYGAAAADAVASLRAELQRTEACLRLLAARKATAEAPALVGIGLFEFAGLRHLAGDLLAELAAAFPQSAAVHERWRTRLLVDRGAETMRRRYAAFVEAATDRATAEWFAGYAALVAGEQHTRDGRREVALAAYAEAVERLARSAAGNEEFADSANHFAVLALAGRAVQKHASDDAAGAVADLQQAAALRPASLDESDGLQRKPRAIAGRIHRELVQAGKTELAEALKPILP